MPISRRRVAPLVAGLVATSIGLFVSFRALPQANTPGVAILLATPPHIFAEPLKAFRQTLSQEGYVENQSIKFEERYAPGDIEKLNQAASELIQLSPKVLLTAATTATQAAKHATSSIPIVFVLAGDPVATKFVRSLDAPGGNITGVTNSGPELSGRRLEVLKEALPNISRVAVIGDSRPAQQAQSRISIELAGKRLGIALLFPDPSSVADMPKAFEEALRWKAEGYITLSQTLTNVAQEQIVALAMQQRLPIIVQTPRGAEAGALISLNDDVSAIFRTAGVQVAKILKGTSPAKLSVLKADSIAMIVNLKTAKMLNVDLPQGLVTRAVTVLR